MTIFLLFIFSIAYTIASVRLMTYSEERYDDFVNLLDESQSLLSTGSEFVDNILHFFLLVVFVILMPLIFVFFFIREVIRNAY